MPRRRLTALAVLALPALAAPAVAEAERFAAVDSRNRLYTFDDSKPRVSKPATLRGLGAGERIVGLDVRPANRQLMALTNAGRLYVIFRGARRAAPIGNPIMPMLGGGSFGMDFNPTVDRIRVTTDGAENLRVHPDTGAATVDGQLQYKAGDPGTAPVPGVIAAAYTNSVAGATMTTLFGIDTRDSLVLQAPPNDGVIGTVGRLGVDLTGPVGFDVSARNGRAYVLGRKANARGTRLYHVSLANGKARQLGVVRGAPALTAMAAISSPAG